MYIIFRKLRKGNRNEKLVLSKVISILLGLRHPFAKRQSSLFIALKRDWFISREDNEKKNKRHIVHNFQNLLKNS